MPRCQAVENPRDFLARAIFLKQHFMPSRLNQRKFTQGSL
jgi:hypothetical protein